MRKNLITLILAFTATGCIGVNPLTEWDRKQEEKPIIETVDTTRILLFGHSFGVDCTELLPQLAVSAGINTVHIGRFISANCSLSEHCSFLKEGNKDIYSESLPGTKAFLTVSKSAEEVLREVKWDYVILQHSLEGAGRYDTFQPDLNNLVSYVRDAQKKAFGSEPVIGWNMFWPISVLLEDGSNKQCAYRLSFYENSSLKMWEAYKSATREMSSDTGIDFIIPTGTAVMAFRRSELNVPSEKELTLDGYHMSRGNGRYLVACTWFEKILAPIYKVSIKGNRLKTDAVSIQLQDMAVEAVKNPFEEER